MKRRKVKGDLIIIQLCVPRLTTLLQQLQLPNTYRTKHMHGAQQMQVCIEKLSNMHIGLLPITPQDAQKKRIYAV